MLKKLLVTVGSLLAILAFIIGTYVFMIVRLIAASSHQAIPPEPVTTAVAKSEEWEPFISAVGSLVAVQGVTVAAQLDGNIVRIAFQPGTEVKAGDLLIQQDISSETAQLQATQAAAELAKINRQRSGELLRSSTFSQQQFDADDATFKQATAQSAGIQSTIDKKTIRAPFSGRLGIRLVNLGQTLKAGDAIVSLQALDPIFADFYVPQQEISHLKPGLPVRLAGDALGGRKMEGKITAINPDIDSATRNVRVEATVENRDENLHPGMFVNVEVVLPRRERVLTIPATSILYAPYGDSIFIVEDKADAKTGRSGKVLRQQFVRLGRKRGDFVSVLSGLKAGETVVTSGTFKLRNGIPVVVSNALAPDAQIAPQPDDS